MSHIAYLSLGSNIGDRENHLRDAISRLRKKVGQIAAISSFYETEPVEFAAQSWFLNCVIQVETFKAPAELIKSILDIEREMGRQRTHSKGPRTIDIDIVLFNETILQTPELTIPHPAMTMRRFVLEPLAEIAPEVRHPASGKTAWDLVKELPPGQEVRRSV